MHPISEAGGETDLYRLYEEKIAEIDSRKPHRPAEAAAPLTWCLAYTAPLQERLAEHWLREAKFVVFIPTFLRRIHRRRQIFEVEVPLFRSYVFIGMGAPRYAEAEGTKGVLELVRSGDNVVAVPEEIVGDLMFASEAGCFLMDERTGWAKRVKPGMPKEMLARFRVGEMARVTAGAFQDLAGKIDGVPAHERIKVLLDVLGRETRVSLPLEFLEPLT